MAVRPQPGTTPLANPQQNSQVASHFRQKRRIRFGMKHRLARRPVHALDVIHEHRPFNLVDVYRQRKRIRPAAAGERTDDDKSAGSVVTLFGDDQGRTPLGLLSSRLRDRSRATQCHPRAGGKSSPCVSPIHSLLFRVPPPSRFHQAGSTGVHLRHEFLQALGILRLRAQADLSHRGFNHNGIACPHPGLFRHRFRNTAPLNYFPTSQSALLA